MEIKEATDRLFDIKRLLNQDKPQCATYDLRELRRDSEDPEFRTILANLICDLEESHQNRDIAPDIQVALDYVNQVADEMIAMGYGAMGIETSVI